MKITEFDPVDLAMAILSGLYNIALVLGTIYLIVTLKQWYPIFILLFVSSLKYKSKWDKENKGVK